MEYNVNQLLTVIDEDGCDKTKPIIIEVGGISIPLQHVYVVTEEMIGFDGFGISKLGSLVLDLDV